MAIRELNSSKPKLDKNHIRFTTSRTSSTILLVKY